MAIVAVVVVVAVVSETTEGVCGHSTTVNATAVTGTL